MWCVFVSQQSSGATGWQDSPFWCLPPKRSEETKGGWQGRHPNHYCKHLSVIIIQGKATGGLRTGRSRWITPGSWRRCCVFCQEYILEWKAWPVSSLSRRMQDRSISEQWPAACVGCSTRLPIPKTNPNICFSTTSSSALSNMWWEEVSFQVVSYWSHNYQTQYQ